MSQLVRQVQDILTNPKHSRWITILLLLGEAALCALIIWRIPCTLFPSEHQCYSQANKKFSDTEIDFTTYMAQVRMFLDGERDYSKITGPTGPLVYPALHVYIYTGIYYLTDNGTDIFVGQILFAGVYLTTLALVFACYRRAGVPPWLFAPLVLSKRLHSIFLLRMFNDCWATLGFWAAIYLFTRRKWELGALVWGLGLGVKMTLLLAMPAVAVIAIQGAGTAEAIFAGLLVMLIHAAMGVPFLNSEAGYQYFHKAFDFGREFMFKWTVNWRFLGEDVFLSKTFAISLLVVHISILLVFVQTKWLRPSSTSLSDFVRKYTRTMDEGTESRFSQKVTPIFVMDTMLGSMVIGLLCARSLHYQFFSYLGWTTPYLLWRAGGGPVWVALNWMVQEYCWLVFPSTDISSALVVFELSIQVMCALIAPPVDHISPPIKPVGVKSPER